MTCKSKPNCDVVLCFEPATHCVFAILNEKTRANFCAVHREQYWQTLRAFNNAYSAFMTERVLKC